MEFKQGTSVYTSHGEDVGGVDRVVLNPNTKQITHIVVRKGVLFPEDKIVPLSLIASADEDRVVLRRDAGELNDLPPFEETHYVPLDETEVNTTAYPTGMASPLYWYPPMGGWMGYAGYRYGYAYPPPYPTETEQNIPEGTVALKEGAKVVSADNQHVGNLKRIFTEAQHNRATHFLLSDGFLFKEKKLVPVNWIREIQEDTIHLGVGAAIVDRLREYQE